MILSLRNVLLGLLAAIAPAFAQPATAPATQPGRGETLATSVIIHAPAEQIFEHFTTGPGFAKAMGVAKATVDFRVGGQIRSAYKPDTDLASEQAIVNTILAYEPGRMIAIKATAPAGSPDWLQAICRTGWSVIRLDPISERITRVTVTGMGYEPGPQFDTAYKFFKQGNTATLELMKKRLDAPDTEARGLRAMELLKGCVGSEWTMQFTTPEGKSMHGKTTWRSVLDEKFVMVDGELGNEQTLRPHAVLTLGWDAEIGAPFFHQLMENGAIARGYLAMEDDRTVGGVWSFSGPAGVMQRYISYEFVSADAFTVRMWATGERRGEPQMMFTYHRSRAGKVGG